VAFSPDSRVIASGSGDKTVRLWDAALGGYIEEDTKGADAAAKDNRNGWTALHQAVEMGNEAVVQLLLGEGADVAVKDEYGYTALDCAANPGVARLLRSASPHSSVFAGPSDGRADGGRTDEHTASQSRTRPRPTPKVKKSTATACQLPQSLPTVHSLPTATQLATQFANDVQIANCHSLPAATELPNGIQLTNCHTTR
jgi:ankyrin repeat protein